MTTKPASKTPKNSTRIRLDDLCAWLANRSFAAQCERLDKCRSSMQRSRSEGESEAYTAALAKVREVFAPRISPPVIMWAVVSKTGKIATPGISPNRTCAIRRFLEMPINTPPGSGRAELQRKEWAISRKMGFALRKVEIRLANAEP